MVLRKRYVVDTSTALHKSMVNHWMHVEHLNRKKATRMPTRFERIMEAATTAGEHSGDECIARIRDTFHNGIGIEWGTDQIRVFETFLFACLPLIYGNTWNDNKARVLAEWGKKELRPYVVVSMARRNGKTFVTSGTVVALLLCIPGIRVVIFSTCKRTSQLMMSAVSDMLDAAFDKGTHCNRQEYVQVSRNTEAIVFEAFGTKRAVACLPGSVRVSFYSCARERERAHQKKVRNRLRVHSADAHDGHTSVLHGLHLDVHIKHTMIPQWPQVGSFMQHNAILQNAHTGAVSFWHHGRPHAIKAPA